MIVRNMAAFPVFVIAFANGKFGEEYMVMPGESEVIKGPLFLRVPGGEDIYVTISRDFVVTDQGRYDEKEGVLLVSKGKPCSITWEVDGQLFGIRAWHFHD